MNLGFFVRLVQFAFLRNMQFIMAIVEFVIQSQNNIKFFKNRGQNNLLLFVDFVFANKNYYGHLAEYMELNKPRIDKGEIRAQKALNCDFYPTQKMKITLAKTIQGYTRKSAHTIKDLDTLISHVNPEKSPKTLDYLQRTMKHALERGDEVVYFNNLTNGTF